MSGLRLREWRTGVHLPDDLALPNLAGDSTSTRPGGRVHGRRDQRVRAGADAGRHRVAGRARARLPVVVKGVQRADDAVRCVEAGAAAVVVSNHGARQLADAPATADILAEVVDAVGGRAEVYVDGGLRRAPDVVKALALGARAALVGRPSLWALATGGADGVAGDARLVRVRTPTGDGAVRCGDGRRAGPEPRAAHAGNGGIRMTTVAAMVAARADDDRTGVLDIDGRSLDLAPGGGGGCGPGGAGAVADGIGAAACRAAPPQRPRVSVLAQRRRVGGGGDRRDQPDAPG